MGAPVVHPEHVVVSDDCMVEAYIAFPGPVMHDGYVAGYGAVQCEFYAVHSVDKCIVRQ